MNTRRHPSPRTCRRGSALLAALCFSAVLAVALGSYITVCFRTLELSTRTLRGMHDLTLAESGMEDVLWSLNQNNWDGWTINGTTAQKTVEGFVFDGGVAGSVNLTVTNFNGTGGTRVVTVRGITVDPAGGTQTRTLTSVAERAPLFVNAVAATTGRVRFRSGGSADSYNSTLGDYSSQVPGYSAVISSGSTSTTYPTVQLGDARIKGFVATVSTGPSYGTSGALLGPSTEAGTKIDPSRISTSPYQPLFDEVVPSGSGTVLPAGSATIGVPGATSPAFYYGSNLSLIGAEVLTVNGPVLVVLSGDLMISDAAKIRITATGSLRIHVQGVIAINGAGIENLTKLPKNLVLVSTANPTAATGMATDTPYYGVIYTPVSAFIVGNSQAIYGAIVARSVIFRQSPAIHYDIALRSTVIGGVNTPFGVGRWRETYDGT